MPPHRPLVIGHRGAPGYRPEHTRSSYALALEQGADAVEPDIVFTRDGVAVVRHENEIGGTTDVADRAEFASRRATKVVDGVTVTGWFTEDFTWAELSTLRCRERVPHLRAGSAGFDGQEPPLRVREVLDLVRAASCERGRELTVVAEVKHATYFARLGYDVAGLLADELRDAGRLPLVIESFETTILARLRALGIRAEYVLLFEDDGRPYDLTATLGDAAPSYRFLLTPAGLDGLVGAVEGISLDKRTLLRVADAASLVGDAHARGLRVLTWTCRPENAFLDRRFRRGEDPAAIGDYGAEWRAIADTGVDGVFVDHPDLGVALFR
ncbi:MAG: glycerophosphodiester phosphodiesterase family protein [Microbacterium sp.]